MHFNQKSYVGALSGIDSPKISVLSHCPHTLSPAKLFPPHNNRSGVISWRRTARSSRRQTTASARQATPIVAPARAPSRSDRLRRMISQSRVAMNGRPTRLVSRSLLRRHPTHSHDAKALRGRARSCPRGSILLVGRNDAIRRTDVLVRPCEKTRGATDEDVRHTPQSGPRSINHVRLRHATRLLSG